jgi:hypothetical protein
MRSIAENAEKKYARTPAGRSMNFAISRCVFCPGGTVRVQRLAGAADNDSRMYIKIS